jgi:NAD(P)H-hydrate epimerase
MELMIPNLILMENAGRGAAHVLAEMARDTTAVMLDSQLAKKTKRAKRLEEVKNPRVLVLCGPGNNGGDGGVVARHLSAWGLEVQVIWLASCSQLSADAMTQCVILEKSGIAQIVWYDVHNEDPNPRNLSDVVLGVDWIVDGLLGTGLSRPMHGPFRSMVELINHSKKPILALDVPSGLDADTGLPLGVAVRAKATATFVSWKLGFTRSESAVYTGQVKVVDIGLPRSLLQRFEC